MLIDNIEKIYDIVSDFHQHALYQDVMTEKYIERQIHPQDRYIIKGFIDKVMIDEENGYYAIVDYKYSSKSFNMSAFERGLKLQLPFYLYLFDEETNLKPSGVFFRQTGMNREKSQEAMNLKMNGVFLNDEKQMKRLDPQANHISGLGYKKDGTLRKNANQLSENEFNDMHHKMEEMIVEAAEKIEKGQFEINPILNIEENHQSISCQYCPFGAICYSKNKRLKEDSREIHNITK
jgi:ATP-dependent helicase/DNAse subunit B